MQRKRLGIAAVGAALVLAASITPANTSSHREAPLIAGEPQLDSTDTYAFVSPDKPDTVTLIHNVSPIQDPTGGPNFYPFSNNAKYNLHIDNNHDAKADITYQWRFKSSYRDASSFLYNTGPVNNLTDPTLNFVQTYTIARLDNTQTPPAETVLASDLPVAPSHVGDASMPNYANLRNQAIRDIPGGKVFAGQAYDPFFLDLRVFDLLYGANLKEAGNNTLTNISVNTMAVQVPKADLALNKDSAANPIVGIYADVERPAVRTQAADGSVTFSPEFVHVSRLGMPLVNEVVIDLARKDKFNASLPANDGEYLDRVTKPLLPKLIEAIYKIKAPPEPRNDLVSVFLTGVEGLNKPAGGTPNEMLRLNMSIAPTAQPKRLGVLDGDTQGFPNGRRLSDDVIDISLQVVMGELVGTPSDLGDGVDANTKPFLPNFPYVALPTSGSSLAPRGVSAVNVPNAPTAGGSPGGSTTPRGAVDTGAGGTAGRPFPAVPAVLAMAGLGLGAWGLAQRRRQVPSAG